MSNKQARKRYFSVFFPAMVAYLASVFGVSAAIDDGDPVTWLTYIMALTPAIFVFLWMWSHARYILEIDEFLRTLQIKAVLWGLIATAAISTAWGFLEFFAEVPKIPIFYVLPGFYGFYGIAALIISKRENAGCAML